MIFLQIQTGFEVKLTVQGASMIRNKREVRCQIRQRSLRRRLKNVKQLTEMAVKYGGWTSRDKPIDEERRFCSCIHDVQN